MASIQAKIAEYQTASNEFPPLMQLSEKIIAAGGTGAKPDVIAGVTLLLLFVALAFDIGGSFLVSFIGFVWPAYMSFCALEDGKDDDTDTQWLTYWVVYNTFTVLEHFPFLFSWIPLYHLVKMAFLVYCIQGGAQTVYDKVLKPTLNFTETKLGAHHAAATAKDEETKAE